MSSEAVSSCCAPARDVTESTCACAPAVSTSVIRASTNTLAYTPELCINCGMCSAVCPHGVFAPDGRVVQLARPEACMECGACQQNCPTGAITVDSGVGCAAAMIYAALTGKKEASCGDDDGASCCG